MAHPLPSTDQKPTMPELIAFEGKTKCINIPEKIGLMWITVGTLLLDDRDGDIVPAIENKYRDNALRINSEILAQWVQGRGTVEHTWRGLIGVLRKANCESLAKSIEEAVTHQPELPSSSTPTCPFLQLQSAEWHFAEYLKSIYNCPLDTVETWPPAPGEIYINLAIITREKIKTKEQHAETAV